MVTGTAVRTGTYLYPWDVVGDPTAADGVAALGVDSASLAAAYHAVRGVTSRHPQHRVVVAPDAATYFEPDPSRWRGRRLRPQAAGWLEADSFATAAAGLRRAGVGVSAWVVVAHNNAVGSAHPDVCVTNAFGDRYPWALCIDSGEVGEYATTLVAEVVERLDVDAIELEACGWYGVEHLSAHDKAQLDKLSEATRYLLSLCFCPNCRRRLGRAGVDVERLRALVTESVDASFNDADADDPDGTRAAIDVCLGRDLAAAVLGARLAAAERFRVDVVAAARRASMGRPLAVWLRGQTTAPTTGGNVGIDLSGAGQDGAVPDGAVPDGAVPDGAVPDRACSDGAFPDVDGILLSLADETAGSIEAAASLAAVDQRRLGVVVDVLARRPEEAEELEAQRIDHAKRGGLTELHLYHAGLATAPGRSRIAALVRRFAG